MHIKKSRSYSHDFPDKTTMNSQTKQPCTAFVGKTKNSAKNNVQNQTLQFPKVHISAPHVLTLTRSNKTGNVCINTTLEAHSQNHYCHGKAISITYFKCVFVASIIQHTKHMCHIILSSVACPALPYFSNYLINDTVFRKELLNIKCVF